jgi:hypothetical protein
MYGTIGKWRCDRQSICVQKSEWKVLVNELVALFPSRLGSLKRTTTGTGSSE